jgi:hypothetical protein
MSKPVIILIYFDEKLQREVKVYAPARYYPATATAKGVRHVPSVTAI